MNNRIYDPVIGRILSPDPFVQSPTNTQSYNRYSYCLNNPLRYTDPSGYNKHPDDWGMEPVFYATEFGPGYTGSLGSRGGGGGGNYSYNSYTGQYVLDGNYVPYGAVYFNYVLPKSSIHISGPNAGEIVSKVMDGFSIYTYDLYGRQNLVLSIGDPELVANTGSDGGYFTKNPTAGSYAYGAIAIGQSKNGFANMFGNYTNAVNSTSFVMGLSSSMYGEAARGLTTTTSALASEIQAAKIIGNIGKVARIGTISGIVLNVGANTVNVYLSPTAGNYGRLTISLIAAGVNILPGGPLLSIGITLADAAWGHYLYEGLDNYFNTGP